MVLIMPTRTVRHDFLQFDGEDPDGWLEKTVGTVFTRIADALQTTCKRGTQAAHSQSFDKLSPPLIALLKKDAFRWDVEALVAFKMLKDTMIQTIVLTLPNFSKPFVIECNASGTGNQ
ncbi:hypothetical protein HHK36_027266 [Tetracentron sinense]|uniref:Reverse transcriptase/retrotransposon-derived protein RNase H-like domain-containing protein n=1 Tax=Tetracentron sinense TaxID=13715 RepID=A0A834YGI7_TETSI|nr:hypothetical protein HHK36_027266 [Tetracentron sinense]